MASGRYNTMAEGLAKIAQDLTLLMATPDADLDFLTDIQTEILGKMREPYANTPGQAPPANAGQGQMPPEIAAMMGGQMPASPIPGAGGPPPGPGGMMAGPGNPNPDEMRRLMGG